MKLLVASSRPTDHQGGRRRTPVASVTPRTPSPTAFRSVLSTIRRVLDPERRHPADHYVVADGPTVAVNSEHVGVDLFDFNRAADRALALVGHGELEQAEPLLRRAREIYTGDFLEEDLYEDWAVDAREEARSKLLSVLRALARWADARQDYEAVGQYLAELLQRDAYDEDAWLALVAVQIRLRHHGEARRRYAVYARRMAELGVAPVPLADASRQP